MKCAYDAIHLQPVRRSPCGERGLKLHCVHDGLHPAGSLPVRGAWIEIFCA